MPKTLHKIGAISFANETTYGITAAGPYYLMNLVEPPSAEGLLARYIEDESFKAGLYKLPGVIGEKSGSTISFRMDVHGLASSPLAAPMPFPPTPPPPPAAMAALAMGNWHSMGAAFGTIQVGGATNILDVGAGEGLNYVAGQPVLTETLLDMEPLVIKSIAGDNLTTRQDTIDVAGCIAGKTVYSGLTVFPATAWIQPSITCQLLGQSTLDKWVLKGMRPTSLKFIGTPKDFVTMEMDFSVYDWDRPGAGGAPAYVPYPWPPREHLVGGVLRIQDGAAAITQLDFTSFEFDFGLQTTQPTDGTMTQGTNDLLMTDFAARLTVDPSYLNEALISAFSLQTKYDLILKYGSQPGRTFLLTLPQAEMVQFPSLHNGEEVKRQKLVFEAKVYAGDTGAVTDLVPTSKDCAACWL